MSLASDCPGCSVGDHDKHDPDHGIRPDLTGTYCDCKGDCGERLKCFTVDPVARDFYFPPERKGEGADDRLVALGEALHIERTERHTERSDCWACEAVNSPIVHDLAIDSSVIDAVRAIFAKHPWIPEMTIASRVHWLVAEVERLREIEAQR